MEVTDRETMKQVLDAWQTSVYGSDSHHKAMLLAITNMAKAIQREALLEAAENDVFEHAMAHGFTVADRLRKMAEELK
jgi:hypothetical protein